MPQVVVSGSFDDLRSREVRFLQEASRLGDTCVLLWSDDMVRAQTGTAPKFPQDERLYFVRNIRYVNQVRLIAAAFDPDTLPQVDDLQPDLWVMHASDDSPARRATCNAHRIGCHVLHEADLQGFPLPPAGETPVAGQKIVVTGCFDWLHSGHVRFFEEASQLGVLYVVVGSDANVRLLKGENHPLFPAALRQYMVGSIRTVRQALISSGSGWMDAEPEIEQLQPDCYVVNEDGDKPDKQAFCAAHGLEYVVLKRTPKEGLPRRESTHLRGF